jgi:hypothetical protein
MSDFATWDGARIVEGAVTIPMYGIWSAEFRLGTDAQVAQQSTLQIGNLSLKGFVYRQGAIAGQRSVRLGGGAGGWRQLVGARSYHMPTGVPLAMVLADVAASVGETINAADLAGAAFLGGYYVRDADPASRVLRRLAGPLWWVDTDGTTRITARGGGEITTVYTLVEYDGSAGLATIATEDLASWMPGRTFTAATTGQQLRIQSVTHRVDGNGTLRTMVLCQDATVTEPVEDAGGTTLDDRMLEALRQIIRTELPRGFYNKPGNSSCVVDAGTGTGEHVATVEGVINLFTNFIYLLFAAGNPSAWSAPGGLLDANTFPATFNALATTWLTACALPSPPTAASGGGVLPSALPPLIDVANKVKRTGLVAPCLGCAEVYSG